MYNRLGVQHPLQNSLVLNNIFQRCNLTDLKSCRLVCRSWRDSSKLALRSSAVVKIDYRQEGKRMPDFELFSVKYEHGQHQIQITEAPFANFHLRIGNSSWFHSFWGVSIKVLKLDNVRFPSGNIFVKSIFSDCPNLERLTLFGTTAPSMAYNEMVNKETGEVNKVLEQIKWDDIPENKKLKSLSLDTDDFVWEGADWIEFFSRVPSLREITILALVSNCDQFFQSVKTIRERDPIKLILKIVDIWRLRDFSPVISSVLLETNLDLQSLELGQFFLREHNNSLPEILNKHSSSLKKLSLLGGALWSSVVSNDLQLSSQKQLENLQQFMIRCYYKYPLMDFLKLAPNLRKVILVSSTARYLGVAGLDLSATQEIRLNDCTELELHFQRLMIQELKHLISWMPNLRKLKIREVNNEMFSVVCSGWSKLVSLDVKDSTVNDSGITGLDAEDVEKINRNGKRSKCRPVTVPRANITCLQNLQKFSLRAAVPPIPRYKPQLGYCAASLGIELLPNLKHLVIENYILTGRGGTLWKNLFAQYPGPEDDD